MCMLYLARLLLFVRVLAAAQDRTDLNGTATAGLHRPLFAPRASVSLRDSGHSAGTCHWICSDYLYNPGVCDLELKDSTQPVFAVAV